MTQHKFSKDISQRKFRQHANTDQTLTLTQTFHEITEQKLQTQHVRSEMFLINFIY